MHRSGQLRPPAGTVLPDHWPGTNGQAKPKPQQPGWSQRVSPLEVELPQAVGMAPGQPAKPESPTLRAQADCRCFPNPQPAPRFYEDQWRSRPAIEESPGRPNRSGQVEPSS